MLQDRLRSQVGMHASGLLPTSEARRRRAYLIKPKSLIALGGGRCKWTAPATCDSDAHLRQQRQWQNHQYEDWRQCDDRSDEEKDDFRRHVYAI